MGVKTHPFLFPVVANQLPVETTKRVSAQQLYNHPILISES